MNVRVIKDPAESNPPLNPEILKQFDIAGPRYTSYPTADRFVEAFGKGEYIQTLEQRRVGGFALPLSVYIHIPFCESLCFYCACNKVVTKRHQRGTEYLWYLNREIELHATHMGSGQTITQLHLGGGSPTFLSDSELSDLMLSLHRHFILKPSGEYSIEVDPRTVNPSRLEHLAGLGFNRISFGVQDFDHEVQKSVHRIQDENQVFGLVETSRQLGFESINIDLIYGLPKQTLKSFESTLNKVTRLRPDRIALYAYAHLPARFKPQRYINESELPAAQAKLEMLSSAISIFLAAGYVYVGMDHFALPDDALAIAKRQGRLHRNFQGYSTQPDCDLIALGVSAIGRLGASYSQNAKTLDEYYDHLNRGHLPIIRGLAMSRDDLVRRAVIMALMCQGNVQFESIELAYLITFNTYFAQELQSLEFLQNDELVEITENSIQVTALGWFFVRGIAMIFDRYLQTDKTRARFSKII
jgi:oxygen-independent coproporphyrinogen-3 oxidase